MADVPTFDIGGGLTVALGYRRRPVEPKSFKYNLTNYALPTVDLTQPRMFWGSKPDPRLPILNQGSMGSCCSFGAADAATAVGRVDGLTAVELMHDWIYEQARKKEGSFPTDAGSDPADCLDLCMSGVPPQSDQAGGYVANPAATFDQYTKDATQKYVASFHGIFPTDQPNMETLVWAALDSGYPVVVALDWTNAMFSAPRGILPSGQTPAMAVGGHCVYCWGIAPDYYLCDNSWTASWTPDAAASGLPNMRPGSFAIPWAYGRPGSLIQEMYAVVGVAAPAPTPTPTPTPTPACRAAALAIADPLVSNAAAAANAYISGGGKASDKQYWQLYGHYQGDAEVDGALAALPGAGVSADLQAPIARPE